MDVDFPSGGKYVVAVSGGVDSVVLLNLLAGRKDLELTVAHFDHGIRPNSDLDRRFVQDLADKYDLDFIYDEGELGSDASEEIARNARYKFLREVQEDEQAKAIITAHHQDDLIETAILNILRGTNRKGLSSLQSRQDLKRPLLNVPKSVIQDYANDQGLTWREDPSNIDTKYLRNYIRHRIVPRFDESGRDELLKIIKNAETTNRQTDELVEEMLDQQKEVYGEQLDRDWFNQLPHSVAKEVMASWLRQYNVRDFDQNNIERLVISAKTAGSRRKFSVSQGVTLQVGLNSLALTGVER